MSLKALLQSLDNALGFEVARSFDIEYKSDSDTLRNIRIDVGKTGELVLTFNRVLPLDEKYWEDKDPELHKIIEGFRQKAGISGREDLVYIWYQGEDFDRYFTLEKTLPLPMLDCCNFLSKFMAVVDEERYIVMQDTFSNANAIMLPPLTSLKELDMDMNVINEFFAVFN